MLRTIDDLHLSYEEGYEYNTQEWLEAITELRHDVCLEALESFGADLTDKSWDIKVTTEYDTSNEDSKLPKHTNDPFIIGLLKFSNTFISASGGSPLKWQQAVQEVANWYVHNVTAYSQPTMTYCPLTGKQARWDCSGFVTCCLQRYGILQDTNWPPRSGDYADNAALGEKLVAGGFKKYVFSTWDACKPYDIVVYNGHIEIYNGIDQGRHTSWAWGSYHASLPCGTAHVKNGYDYIWRCEGGGKLNINIGAGLFMNANLSAGETGISAGMIDFICRYETGHPFGYTMPSRDINGYDLGDAKGHRTYGYGLLYHPNGKFMDSIKSVWSQKELEGLFLQTVKNMSTKIDSWAKKSSLTLLQQQKDAICSACFNFGPGFLGKQICKMIANNPNNPQIVDTWSHLSDKQGVKYSGLIKRRQAEARWWATGHA